MFSCRVMVAVVLVTLWVLSPAPAAAQQSAADAGLKQFEEQRTDAYAKQLEGHLRGWLVDDYPQRAAKAWNRDYSSIEAFVKSVAPNRDRWLKIFKPPALAKTGPLERRPYSRLAEIKAEWLTLPLGDLTCEALLAVPPQAGPKKPVPMVIAMHGLGSYPERVFGLPVPGAYNNYGGELLKAGFAVLAPMNLRSAQRVNRIERLCRLADTSLPGVELVRLQRLLDAVLADPRIDQRRVGMWGLSRGGQMTMFWMPLEPRITVGVVSAWFNHRRNKMAIPDKRYTCFLETAEEHAFHDGWLIEFSDSDAACLICPRPLMIQTGKKDGIAHWPQVIEEFEATREHYRKLGIADRIEMDRHDGVHESRVSSGLKFLTRWLIEEH